MIKYFSQKHGYDCVPACLYMLLKTLGKDVPSYKTFLSDLGIDLDVGTPLAELYSVLDDYMINFSVKWESGWEDLRDAIEQGIVMVSYWVPEDNESHCAIVREVDEEVILADPWFGDNFVMSKKEFMEKWYMKDDHGWLLIVEK